MGKIAKSVFLWYTMAWEHLKQVAYNHVSIGQGLPE